MTNNDIFKKLRVALQLRDDQIVEILELVDFRISKGELGNIFRAEDHEKYMECGDQLLRNFLNGLVIHLRGTKEEPKNPIEVIKSHKVSSNKNEKKLSETKTNEKDNILKNKTINKNFKKQEPKKNILEGIKFKNGKTKKK